MLSRAPIRTGKLIVNIEARTAEVDGKPISITDNEYALLALMSLHKGSTVTKELLAQRLYGEVNEQNLRNARVTLYNLRKKLPQASDDQGYIETIGGRGYVLRDLVE